MNILEQEDIIKGLPDAALMKEASAPSGQVPQFLVVSEIKRRSDMRKRYDQQEQQEQGTVKDQILAEAVGGIAPMMPTAMTPPAQPMGPAGPPPNRAMPPPMGGMPPQGAPPMAPPMPQGMPPTPMGGIASAPQAMPPMGMAQGGIVQMEGGGVLDSYVPQAQLGPVQGGSTVKDQIDRLIDGKMMSAADILAFAQEAFYGQPEAINYVITRLGGAGAGMEPVGGMTAEDQEAVSEAAPMRMMPKLAGGSDLYKAPMVLRAADALGLFDSYKSKPEDDRMLEPAASALAQQVVDEYAVPDTNMRGIFRSPPSSEGRSSGVADLLGAGFGGADYSSPKPGTESAAPIAGMLEQAQAVNTDASDPRRRLSPSIDIDALMSGVVSERAPRSGGIPDLSTAPQRGAGGRPFDTGVFGDLLGSVEFDLGMPTREQSMAADKARVERIRQKAAGTYDDPNTPEKRIARLAQLAQLDAEGMDETVQDINKRLGIGPDGPVRSPFGQKKEDAPTSLTGENVALIEELSALTAGSNTRNPDITVQGNKNNAQAQGTGANPPALTPDMPALDFSGLIADSKQQALANAMIQLGAGVASGDVSKGLAAAGTAAMKGTADARALDMKRRLAEYQAGREDIRRGEETRRYEEGMKLKREQFDSDVAYRAAKLSADIEAASGLNRRALLTNVSAMIKETNDEILRLQSLGSGPEDPAMMELQSYLNALKTQSKKYATEIAASLAKAEEFDGFEVVGTR